MKVYLEFRSAKHHTLYDEIINYPPEGVEYQVSSGEVYSTRTYKLFNFFYNSLFKNIKPDIGNIYHKLKKEDKNADLVHVCNTFTPRNTSWVMDIENVGSFTAHDIKNFQAHKKKIEKELSSENCKKIMPWTNSGKRTLEHFLDTEEFKDKIEVVSPAIHPLPVNKRMNKDGNIRLLFMGSINNPNSFIFKGGEYAIKCFEVLSKKYDLELIVRSIVPDKIKKKYLNITGLKFIENRLSQKEIFDIYNTSDILLLPGHNYSLMAILESMAFGLPIVAVNGWSTSDFVEHEKTGFLVKPSKQIPITDDVPIDWTPGFENVVKKIDPKVVEDLAKCTSVLMEDNSLRKKMGKLARERIENGDLSIKVRNQKLKRIYEEAMRR